MERAIKGDGKTGPPFVRSDVRRLSGYVPGEQPRGRNYIKLNTNENPYPPARAVLEAVRACANEDLRLYPDPTAEVLREKASTVYGFDPDQVLAGNGSDDLLAMVIRACIRPGDRVAYPVPTYSLYDTLVAIGGGTPVHIPFHEDFSLPRDLASAKARVTFLCNPNSPSGTVVGSGQIAALSERVQGLLVVDEAYVDFADENALALARERANVLVLRTFSKSFSLAGMRIGLAFGAAKIIAELAKVKDSYNLTCPSIAAATAALTEYDWMKCNVERVRETRARLVARLGEMGFAVPPSQANFVLARRPGESLAWLYDGLKEAGILVRYFDSPALRDALRISVGTDAEVDALLDATQKLVAARDG